MSDSREKTEKSFLGRVTAIRLDGTSYYGLFELALWDREMSQGGNGSHVTMVARLMSLTRPGGEQSLTNIAWTQSAARQGCGRLPVTDAVNKDQR